MMYFSSDKVGGSKMLARYNDEDFSPSGWSNFREIDLNQTHPYLDQDGSFTRRAYHFRHYSRLPFRIKSADLQMDLGTL